MTLPSADEGLLRRYLLGTVSDAARKDLEARLFSDDRVFWERIAIAEDELVGDYVQNALNQDERQEFDKHFLCTDERRSKVEFAKALHAHAARSAAPLERQSRWAWLRRPVLSPAWGLAAAALLLVAIQIPRLGSPAPEVDTGNIVAVSLSAERTRAAGETLARVQLNPKTQLVRLQLVPGLKLFQSLAPDQPSQHASYRAAVYQVDGDSLIAEMKLTPSSAPGNAGLTLTLPTELLAEGDYYVRLHGISPGAEPVPLQRYDFRVLRD